MGLVKTIRETFGFGEAAREVSNLAANQVSARDAAKWLHEVAGDLEVVIDGQTLPLREAFTQADIELALDDRGWLVGGKRMAGELDPLSRMTQVNKSRYYWLRDPLAKHAVRLWTDYALGDEALTWKAEDEGVQANLDKFMRDRRNRAICTAAGQRRLSTRLLVDGELFLAFFADGTVRNYDCLQVIDIITDPDDQDKVLGYKRVTWLPPSQTGVVNQNTKTLYYRDWTNPDEDLYDPMTKKKVDAEKDVVIYHLPFDNLTARGNGLLSCCSDWSRENRRFMTARVAITQALSKFAMKTTIKGGQQMVNSIRAKLESTFAQTGLSGGTEHQPPVAPGGNWLQNDGINLEQFKVSTGASDAREDSNNLKLMFGAGVGIFLHYFGDPSTGNLATATAMELPMFKEFMSYQKYWRDSWREMQAIVLQEEPDDEPAKVVNTYPAILEDDIQKLSQWLTSLVAAFPHAATDSVLRQCLSSANVPNLDDVMDEILKNKEQRDANVKAGLNPDGSKPVPIQVASMKAGDKGQEKKSGGTDDGQGQSLGAGGVSGSLEADITRLSAAVAELAEVLK